MKLPRLNISASAGSGKTFALSTHYVAMLIHGAPPESVFASTFTRKAASEILDRVLVRIATAARSDDEATQLADHIHTATGHRPAITAATCADLLARLMKQLHRLGISTLDAFFVRTATCFSLELNLPPGWRIASEVQQRQLAAEAVDELLREAEDRDPQALVELVRQVNRGTADRSVHETLLSLFRTLHPIYQETAATSPEAWQTPITIPPGKLDDAALQDAITNGLASVELPLTKAGSPVKAYIKALKKVTTTALARDWSTLLDETLVAAVVNDPQDPKYSGKELPPTLRAALQTLIDHARAVLLEQLVNQRTALHRLLTDYDRHYRALQVRRRAFRFDDVTRSLGYAASLPSHQEIYYRLDARIQHILLDEFQDTSLAQWRALEPVAAEVLAHGDGSRASLIVADPKQSIYGWRGGEPELVRAIAKQFALDNHTLRKSFRSSPVVLETVNTICEALPDIPCLAEHRQVVNDWLRAYTPHQAAFDLPGHAQVHVADLAANAHDQDHLNFRRAAQIIKDITEADPTKTVGVLVRTNKAVRQMIHQLRLPDVAVEASEEGGNPLTDSPAVCAILSLLRLADHPSDTISRFHVATTPLGEVLDFTDHHSHRAAAQLAADIRQQLLVEGYGQTLHQLTQRLAPHCDQRDLARLLQLVELGCAYEADANIRTRDFITLVQTTRIEDVTAAPVRVMTVHQSKGLEFDTVILPELDVKPLGQGAPPPLLTHREHPISPITTVFPGPTAAVRNALPEVFDELWRSHEAQQMRDALSTLYVALTRARHGLHMVISPTRNSQIDSPPLTFTTILRQALQNNAPAEPNTLYHEAGSPPPPPSNNQSPIVNTQSPISPSPSPASLLASSKHRNRTLPRRSPSSMHDDRTVDLASVLRLDSGRSLNLGSAIHALCEHVHWHDEDGPPDRATLRSTLTPFDLRNPDGVVDNFLKMIAEPAIAAALSRTAYPAEADIVVKREHPFALRLNDTLVTGLFDRLVLIRDAAGRTTHAEVLDYKTDRVDADDAAALDQLINRYRPQLDTYRDAAARLYNISRSQVTTKLLLMSPAKVITLTPTTSPTANDKYPLSNA
ncbi:MAG: UvrD-helicase domain-containing protein [Phycisphaeraceae bacterium]